ncbi:MAG: nucleotide exchange factor GrpE [Bacteroidales bacterium]|nr:nucleotide exchange factor GrpE [Bacteroidales bacterium]MBQ9597429.1 nucleotide exchange factor GrpE [Bacteroidales bacterium]
MSKNKHEKQEKPVVEDVQQEEGTQQEESGQQPVSECKQLQKEVESLKAQVEQDKDDYLRLRADFENFRRHASEDRLKLITNASADLIKGMLPVLDDCERAMKMIADTQGEDSPSLEGVKMIYTKLFDYLKSRGLALIEAKGQPFDTDKHEAVAQFPVQDEAEKGKVFDVAQNGYTLHGEIIRYAKVVVGI